MKNTYTLKHTSCVYEITDELFFMSEIFPSEVVLRQGPIWEKSDVLRDLISLKCTNF